MVGEDDRAVGKVVQVQEGWWEKMIGHQGRWWRWGEMRDEQNGVAAVAGGDWIRLGHGRERTGWF